MCSGSKGRQPDRHGIFDMRHVKRYSNRKLYDQDDRGYTTLRGLAEKIRRGDEVIVVDHVTGADITSQTLTQIISSEAAAAEEGKSSPVSVEVLARVIRDGIPGSDQGVRE